MYFAPIILLCHTVVSNRSPQRSTAVTAAVKKASSKTTTTSSTATASSAANVSKTTTASKKKKATAAATKAVPTHIEGMPDYSSMTPAALKIVMAKYGLKQQTPKLMAAKLRDIW
jgi:hypothetical protein